MCLGVSWGIVLGSLYHCTDSRSWAPKANSLKAVGPVGTAKTNSFLTRNMIEIYWNSWMISVSHHQTSDLLKCRLSNSILNSVRHLFLLHGEGWLMREALWHRPSLPKHPLQRPRLFKFISERSIWRWSHVVRQNSQLSSRRWLLQRHANSQGMQFFDAMLGNWSWHVVSALNHTIGASGDCIFCVISCSDRGLLWTCRALRSHSLDLVELQNEAMGCNGWVTVSAMHVPTRLTQACLEQLVPRWEKLQTCHMDRVLH